MSYPCATPKADFPLPSDALGFATPLGDATTVLIALKNMLGVACDRDLPAAVSALLKDKT